MTLTDTQSFLKELFDSKPDNHWILLWELNGHKSIWFQEHALAADYVSMTPDDIYFGVGTSSKDFGPAKRCPQKAIAGLPGFYVDIDINDKKAHKGKKYPISMDEALSLVNGHGFDPTVIINSGYGIHCYWLFTKMWTFENEPEWFRAKMLSKRMNETIKKRALDINRDIDSIFDLSRVLRPPGSFNCKKKKKVEVTVHSYTGNKYDPAFFDNTLDKQPIPDSYETSTGSDELQKEILTEPPAKKPVSKGIVIDMAADPNAEKMMEMATIFENFTSTWNHDRADLPSPSEYDMSLANFGAEINMTDQEIANLIIAFRRKHNLEPEKCKRKKYIIDTIVKAKKKAGSDEAIRKIGHLNRTKGTEYESSRNREEYIEAINKKLKPHLSFIDFIQERFGPRPKEINYVLKVGVAKTDSNGNTILDSNKKPVIEIKRIDGGHTFLSAPGKNFTNDVQSITKILVDIPSKEWKEFSQALSHVAIEVLIGEAKTHEKMTNWIEGYFRNVSKKNTFEDSVDSRQPFYEKGHWYLFIDRFQRFVENTINNKIDENTLKSDMNDEGFVNEQNKRATLSSGNRIKRSVWRVPKGKYNI